jgi:2-keto-4-pentenoate hydratase/2-oxohepta-3-ene-1,7-dioic acid hydratase in catechol pathway
MKVALFNEWQLGIVRDDRIYDIGSSLFRENPPRECPMIEFIRHYETYQPIAERLLAEAPSYPLSEVRLRQPVSRPNKIVAAPVNYLSHKQEMNVSHTARVLGFFLKANSSMIGHGDRIELPGVKAGRRIDHELELAFVIGRRAKNVKAEDAYRYIFGYTGLNDVSLRPDGVHEEERCLRKSFDTFTPVGPWIVTGDEIGDPQNLNMTLTVNGQVRQQVNTKYMICSIAELVEIYSHVMTLEPGDIIATGTPDGVGPIRPGDTVAITIERIGALVNPVGEEIA